MNEATLARKLSQGSRLALNQAIDAYTPYLTTVVWHTVGPTASAEDVEEIISDVFLALWSHRANLCPELGLKSWLAAAARNKAIDRLRAAPPAHLPLDEASEAGSVTPEEDLEQPPFCGKLWRTCRRRTASWFSATTMKKKSSRILLRTWGCRFRRRRADCCGRGES